jgi:hypothetical protein
MAGMLEAGYQSEAAASVSLLIVSTTFTIWRDLEKH